MQARLAADAREFAEQLNPSSACRLAFLLQPERVVEEGAEGEAARATAEGSLRQLIRELEVRRDEDSPNDLPMTS